MVLITPSSSHRSSSISSCSPTSFTPSSSNSDVPYTRTTRCPSAWTQTHDRPEGSGTTLISTVTSWVSSGAPPVMSLMSTPRVPVGDVERLVLGHLAGEPVGGVHLSYAANVGRRSRLCAVAGQRVSCSAARRFSSLARSTQYRAGPRTYQSCSACRLRSATGCNRYPATKVRVAASTLWRPSIDRKSVV